ncbi:MAG: hypothetical protein KQH67_06665 [Bacteroidetes bacterium]|nr:hypothetical protein [Bacteroidota bacterium]
MEFIVILARFNSPILYNMIKQFKYFILLLLLSGSVVISYAQYQNTSNDTVVRKQEKKQPLQKRDRWFLGGMLGAGFSSYSAYVEVSPLVGYKVTPAFHVGARFSYIWNSYEVAYDQRENLHHFGIGGFGRYVIFKGLFAQVEYEALNFDNPSYSFSDREWINSLLIGGGYYQSMGRAFASIAILFNVLDNSHHLYYYQPNPVIRIGFGVGF